MLYQTILLLLLLSSPAIISSLECYSCKLIIVNYPVTGDTVPSFSQCHLGNGTTCSIMVSWDQINNTTIIVVDNGNRPPSMQNISVDIITPMAFMEAEPNPDKETVVLAHALFFSCMSSDKCNNETSLKRILRSLVIEDKFREELSSLIKIVSPFDPKSAACMDFDNTTDICPSQDLDTCQRCQISVDKLVTFTEEVCARCPRYATIKNALARSATFVLNNRTQILDRVELGCQLKGCNSFDNINRITKSSKITFDFVEFFLNTP